MCLSYSWPIPVSLSLSRTHIEPHNWDWGILVVTVNDVGVMFATILIMYVILLQLLCYCLHNRFGQNRFFSNPPKVSLHFFFISDFVTFSRHISFVDVQEFWMNFDVFHIQILFNVLIKTKIDYFDVSKNEIVSNWLHEIKLTIFLLRSKRMSPGFY